MGNRRFDDSGKAFDELYDSWISWSSAVGKYGVQTFYALIGVNWAVHGSTEDMITNPWSLASMGVAIVFLALHLILTGCITGLIKMRVTYADANQRVVVSFRGVNLSRPCQGPISPTTMGNAFVSMLGSSSVASGP
jgi:hypothetical protein